VAQHQFRRIVKKLTSIGQHHMAGMKASLCQILSRRAIRKRPKVVNQVGLIEAAREANICPIHLRFASQQIKDLQARRTRQNSFESAPPDRGRVD